MKSRFQTIKRKGGNGPIPRGMSGITTLSASPGQATVSYQTGALPFADRLECRLRYSETISLSTNLTTLASIYQFRLSSIFDPNLSGVGHQPYQRDQISAIYAYYKVHHCAYKVTVFRPNVTGLWAGVNIWSSLAAGGTINGLDLGAIAERNHDIMKIVPTAGPTCVQFSGTVDLSGLHGLSRVQYDTDNTNYGAAMAANPNQNGVLEIAMCDPDARASDLVYALVELEYYVQCYGYVPPTQS